MKRIILLIVFAGSLFKYSHAQIKIGQDGSVGIGSYVPFSGYELRTGSAIFEEGVLIDGHLGLGGYATSSTYSLNAGKAQFNSSVICNSTLKVASGIGIGKDPSGYDLDIWGDFRIYNQATSNHLIFDYDAGYYSPAMFPSKNNTCSLGLSDNRFNMIYTYGFDKASDKRQKEKIRPLKNSLDLVLQLQGVSYDLKKKYAYFDTTTTDADLISCIEKERKDKYGFIAQDVQKVIPGVVNYNDSTDVYGIDYIEIIPFLVEAIKEQNEKITDLESEILNLKSAEKQATLHELSNWIGNNVPNPSSQSTLIEYFLTTDVTQAYIYIYNIGGELVDKILLDEREHGKVEVKCSNMLSGIYFYTLIADSIVIGTRNMIISH